MNFPRIIVPLQVLVLRATFSENWFLLSGIARRATFLWAVLPPFAISIFEKVTFNTSYVFTMLKNRLFGAGDTAFDFQMHRSISVDLAQLTPGRFLATPGLWIGLSLGLTLVAVILLAVWKLRAREHLAA